MTTSPQNHGILAYFGLFWPIFVFVDPPDLVEHSPKARDRDPESAMAPFQRPPTLETSRSPAWRMGSWPRG